MPGSKCEIKHLWTDVQWKAINMILEGLRNVIDIKQQRNCSTPIDSESKSDDYDQLTRLLVTGTKGSGKTYPAICIPLILDILRDTFGHKCIPSSTRVLYIVPLINIFNSLAQEMENLQIPYQIRVRINKSN